MTIAFTQDQSAIESLEFLQLSSFQDFRPSEELGISKYRADLGNSATLDALLVNQGSDVLLVSMHGALPRKTTRLPRFERLRTFQQTPFSSLYFGDPTLYLSERLQLAWFTGWKELDLYPILALWVRSAAAAVGARRIVFVGSSGGGFASLQVSALVPRSIAVPLNPQTAIAKYRPQGSLGNQRNYVKNVMPHLVPPGGVSMMTEDEDWSAPLGVRASVIQRYQKPLENYVLYAQNLNDRAHVSDHYTPFREEIESGPNLDRVRFYTYDGQHTHTSPKPDVFAAILDTALAWSREIKV